MPSITVYDGAGVIGGNKIMLEGNGTSLWCDFGMNFTTRGLFYGDYLSPRASQGLRDYLRMGLLPALRGIYRQDLIGEEVEEMLKTGPENLQGVLLSHTHLDHSGGIAFLKPDTPIYTSLQTALVAKANQDTTAGDLESETVYLIPRSYKDHCYTAAPYKTNPALQRTYRIVDKGEIPEQAQAFWERRAGSREINSIPLSVWNSEKVGSFAVRYFPVDHSIPGAGAFAIHTNEGWIIYTGDLRLHGNREQETRNFIAAAAKLKPLALICEGTNPIEGWPMSEGAVKENIRLAVRNETGYVIACLAARNIERLKTLLDIAEETGRQAVITTRQAYLLNCLKGAGDFTLDLEDILIYGEAKAVRSTWERVLIETSGDRVITPARISKNPANYLLCLGYYDLDQLVDLNPRGGTYLYSSSEAHDEEMAIDLKRLENWAGEFGLKLYGLGKNSTLHSGGHIHAQGLIEMVETINPGFVIPVHTENPRWFKRNWGKRVIIPVAGKAINLI